jgi:excisionase family DNA binding protein
LIRTYDRPVPGGEWLRITEAAALLGVSAPTLRRWDQDGTLVARRTRGGFRVYARADIDEHLARTAPRPRVRNLPPPRGRFIGRTEEIGRLGEMFGAGARIVTVVGAPGVGKTRLAARYAELQARGGSFCDLGEATSLDQVCIAVLEGLGVPAVPHASTERALDESLRALSRRGQVFVVLDDVERVVAHAATIVSKAARAAPESRWLVTSRERLRIADEHALDLAPMPLDTHAIELFVERAGECRAADRTAIAEIVRRLDGIPLAIELAAARTSILAPRALLARLDDRLGVLAADVRDARPRQTTLRAAIDWSWDLLQPHEQRALAQCSVFRGTFSIDAAEAVVDVARGGSVVEVLEALHAKSLVCSSDEPVLGERRMTMLASIREYAAERVRALGLEAGAAEQHAAFFLGRCEPWAQACEGRDELAARRRLVAEAENLLAVEERARGAGDAVSSIRLLAVLERLLWTRGGVDSYLAATEYAVSRIDASLAPALGVLALRARGIARMWRNDFAGGTADFERAVELAGDDRAAVASVKVRLAAAHHASGRVAEAICAIDDALRIHREVRDRHAIGVDLMVRAGIRCDTADRDTRGELGEALEILRDVGRPTHEAMARMYLGHVLQERGALDDARRELLRAADIFEAAGDVRHGPIARGSAASVLHEQGHVEQAIDEYARALDRFDEFPFHPFDAFNQALMAAAYADDGDVARAVVEIERARETKLGATWAREAIDVLAGHIDVARSGLEAARARLAPAEEGAYELRLARRLLRAAIDRAADDGATLVVARDGRWFELRGCDRVDLARRPVLSRVLACFARGRGAVLERDDLFASGWPGERAFAGSRGQRVRSAIAALRDLGLRDVIVNEGAGYAIRRSVRLVSRR